MTDNSICSSTNSDTDTPNPNIRICFICGLQTEKVINIYRSRSGPNILDILKDKFNKSILSDEKHVCLACKNWLTIWLSLVENWEENRPREDGITESNLIFHDELNDLTVTATNHQYQYQHNNDMMMTENDVCVMWGIETTDDQIAICDENSRMSPAIRDVRKNLQQYLYYPKKLGRRPRLCSSDKSSTEDDHFLGPNSYHISNTSRGQKQRQGRLHLHCKLCFVPLRKPNQAIFRKRSLLRQSSIRYILFCRPCRTSLRTYLNRRLVKTNSRAHHGINEQNKPNYTKKQSSNCQTTFVSSQCKTNSNINQENIVSGTSEIVDKLQQLGTTLSYHRTYDWLPVPDTECRYTKINMKPDDAHNDHNTVKYSENDHELRTPGINTVNNEIVLTFNTVITEVFPIQLLIEDTTYDTSNSMVDDGESDYSSQLAPEHNTVYYDDYDASSEADSADEEVAAVTAAAERRMYRQNHLNEIKKLMPKSLTISLA